MAMLDLNGHILLNADPVEVLLLASSIFLSANSVTIGGAKKCQLNLTPFRPQCTTCIGFSAFRLPLVNRQYWTANNVVYYSDINPDIRLQPRFASHFEYD